MRYGRYHLRQSWIFLLMWFLYSVGCPSPSSASTTHLLKDVSVVYQDGQWHVVLTGSKAMTYRALKAFTPLRLVVDLIDTLNEISPSPLVLNYEVIGTVRTVQLAGEPQPRTQVEISLIRDAPHKITRRGEEIWISFYTTQPKIEVEPSRTEPVAKPMAEKPPVTKEVATPKPSPQKPPPPPPPLERKSLPSASKVLSVRQSKMDKELRYDIIVDGSLADYVAFHLTSPPRVVVDLMGVKSTEVEKALSFDGPWVKGVRFGIYADKIRVVFDLIPEAGLPYDIISEEGRLVVSFKPGSGFPAQ
ncbi:MAG: AMIN domain-containing protein [Syntrophobacteria bacterium]